MSVTSINSARPQLSVKKKPRPWNHQTELWRSKGSKITISIAGQEYAIRGELLDADQFTIRIRGNDQSVLTVFKHAITSYRLG